jgi:hypothetical protein
MGDEDMERQMELRAKGPLYANCSVEEAGDFSRSVDHWCVTPYEDDCADAICWISDGSKDPEADACLFSAAPDLLAACKKMRAMFTFDDPKFHDVDAAIKKAEGY